MQYKQDVFNQLYLSRWLDHRPLIPKPHAALPWPLSQLSEGMRPRGATHFMLLNQYICARAAQNSDGRLAHVPPGRAQREPQGYAGLTTFYGPFFNMRVCQTSTTRVRARLDSDRMPPVRARAVRAKCSLAGLTT